MAEEAKEELPPIVMIPEAQFSEKQLNVEFDKLKATLAADVLTLDKAQTKQLLTDVIKRGEIKDEDFTPFFDQLPPAEEEKEPRKFDDAKEVVLRYAVSIKMIPTRLETALKNYTDEFTKPERQLYDFFKNDALSDVTLVHPTSGASYKTHRVIVATGSRYLLEIFMKHSVEDLPTVRVPEPFNQKNEMHSDDQVSRILKYIYGNQSIGIIRDEINEENFYSLYAQAWALGCERLLEDLRELSITSLLNERTVLKLYLDAVEHNEIMIMDACSSVITERFEEICQRGEPDVNYLLELDLNNFVNILRSDNLNLVAEDILIDIVKRYIDLREKVEPKKVNTLEAQTPPELWALLTEAERETRKVTWQEQEDKRVAAETESMEADAIAYFEKDVTGRIQHVLDLKQKARNLKVKESSDKIKLTDDEKVQIFRCIRYAFLPQESLLKLSTDPDFALAKEFIVQGLACKLGGVDQFNSDDLKIVIKKRHALEMADAEAAAAAGMSTGEEQNPNEMQIGSHSLNDQQPLMDPANVGINDAVPPTKRSNVGRDIANKDNFATMSEGRARSSQGFQQSAHRTASPNSRVPQTANMHQAITNNRFGRVYPHMNFAPGNDLNARTMGAQNAMGGKSLTANLLEQSYARGDQNTLTGMPFTNTMVAKQSVNSRPPQRQFPLQQPPLDAPTDFYFEYNLDENGVLYWLGSGGKRRLWQNPHSLGQVQAFASSIGPGCQVDSFVGRSITNCRTEDEPYSFFGVDLGMERKLTPTHYTLRNRNSPTHVLRNWYFEGSQTGTNWVILDARIYNSENNDHNTALENEHRELQKKGGAMTFQIDTEIYRKLGMDGYRFFRIVQVGKNTNGSDHLSLSGFELYGRVQGGPWNFQ